MAVSPPLPHACLFLLLGITAVTALVEQPTNVTLHCRSLTNNLTWNYGHFPPGLKFRVNISSFYRPGTGRYPPVIWVTPPDLHADLSFLSDVGEVYSLYVTAVVGNEESDPAPPKDYGITFSYKKTELVDNMCFMDFPVVNVTLQPHNHVLLRFEHPWLLVQQKLVDNRIPKARRKKSHDVLDEEDLPDFNYDVVIVNQHQDHHSFYCVSQVCEELLPVDPHLDKHCLQIDGDVETMMVKGQQAYCALLPPEKSFSGQAAIIGVGVALTAVVVGGILYMVYHKRTRPSTQTPSILTFGNTAVQRTVDPLQESFSPLEVRPRSRTPLLAGGTEEEVGSPPATPPNQYDSRPPVPIDGDGVPNEPAEEDVSDEPPRGGEVRSPYGLGNDLEEDETPNESSGSSAYESRQALVDLGTNEPGNRLP